MASLGDVESRKAVTTWTLGTAVEFQQVGNTWTQGDDIVSLSLSGDLNIFDKRVGDKPARVLHVRLVFVSSLCDFNAVPCIRLHRKLSQLSHPLPHKAPSLQDWQMEESSPSLAPNISMRRGRVIPTLSPAWRHLRMAQCSLLAMMIKSVRLLRERVQVSRTSRAHSRVYKIIHS